MPLGFKRAEQDLCCSFCRKSKADIGQLIANPRNYPRAYICDECVAVCSRVIAEDIHGEKGDPIEGNPLLSEFVEAAEQWIVREDQGLDPSEQLLRLRQVGRQMFLPQSEF